MRQNFLILAMLLAAASALAQDRPPIRPNRDVAVEYRSSGTAAGQAADPGTGVTMRFSGKTSRVRIDGPNGRGYAILDTAAGNMIVVMPDKQAYLERPADPGMLAMFTGTNTSFRKSGSDTIAGVACTVYDATINERAGKLCLTNDGVMLRARSDDPDRQRQLEAVKVTFADQPASLFETPAGFKKLDVPDQGRRPISGFGPPDPPRGSYMGTPTGR